MAEIILATKREKSLRRKHPWIFSGAISRVKGNPSPGETVDILASGGTFLGKGAFFSQV